MTPPDPWFGVRRLTPARVALGRSGASLPTGEVLRFGHAHARARDAVHRPLDIAALCAAFPGARVVASRAADRAAYLRRPDLGRRLGAGDLAGVMGDVALVLADGLSSAAVEAQAPAVVAAIVPALALAGLTVSVPVIATQARVALGDDVAAAIGARAVLVLIGERPGLSVPASLGAYLTWSPDPGVTTDADRNCVSNIQPNGLLPADAAARIVWLLVAARDRGGSGVALKDDSGGLARLSGVSGGDHRASGAT